MSLAAGGRARPPRAGSFPLLALLASSALGLAHGARPSLPAFAALGVPSVRGLAAPILGKAALGGGRFPGTGRLAGATLQGPRRAWAPARRGPGLCASGGAADDSVDEWGRTALQVAVKGGDVERARALLEGGVAVDVASVEGDSTTPLHTAAMRGSKELVLLLLEFGADKQKEDDFGCTAWDVAKEEGHEDLLSDLKPPLKAAADPEPIFKSGSDRMVMNNNKRYTQDEAEAIMHERADWRAAEAGRETEESMLQMVTDPNTGEMFVRRVPLRGE